MTIQQYYLKQRTALKQKIQDTKVHLEHNFKLEISRKTHCPEPFYLSTETFKNEKKSLKIVKLIRIFKIPDVFSKIYKIRH